MHVYSGLNVPFLNYLANLKARTGQGVNVRVGGNTQELTKLFFEPFNKNFEIINKTVIVDSLAPVRFCLPSFTLSQKIAIMTHCTANSLPPIDWNGRSRCLHRFALYVAKHYDTHRNEVVSWPSLWLPCECFRHCRDGENL